MCGILGRFQRRLGQRPPLSPRDLATLAHRGPDGSGVFTNPYIQLGHSRLAIIDLTEGGQQPMILGSGRYVVTYNGEIYNYLEIRSELEAKGERFTSSSDTEVLLAAYKVWGRACVNRFRGMFAFALWDEQEKTLFLARDRCGEKPLFYHRDGDCFSFASELKGLLPLLAHRPALDSAVVDMYLHYQYVPEPYTLLQGVHKLPAAHTLVLTPRDWHAEPLRYWNVEDIVDSPGLPADRAGVLPLIRDAVEDAVTLTLRSDVPVGVALSGGIDSGAIAALAQRHYPEPMHAFCVGYPGRPSYDERHHARQLAEQLGMIVHEVELPVESFVDFFPQLVRIMDEPIADPAAFGHYSVPKAAADQGIKVLLTGLGGDELFWGYPWVAKAAVANETIAKSPLLASAGPLLASANVHRILRRMTDSPNAPSKLRRWTGFLQEIADSYTPKNQLRFYTAAPDFNDARRIKDSVYGPAMRNLLADNPFKPTDIGPRAVERIPAAIIRLLFDTWLTSNSLSLGDRVSMGVGVESRLPFLDVRLIELVMALRNKYPDHTLGQKAWLRAALKGVLPDDVLARPKAGFQPPVWEWLSGVVARYGSNLRDGHLVKAGILAEKKADYVLQELPKQGWPGLFFSYKLVLLEQWFQEVVVCDS
ncbi:MAG TPA: asparagine synthase (glutamine-hydrolyzing) [Pyrinomonadaceae bacterium]|nr:asparagine synthase (glutamine-hydrolyzing) [Pyrinomonadaceae bacterium]